MRMNELQSLAVSRDMVEVDSSAVYGVSVENHPSSYLLASTITSTHFHSLPNPSVLSFSSLQRFYDVVDLILFSSRLATLIANLTHQIKLHAGEIFTSSIMGDKQSQQNFSFLLVSYSYSIDHAHASC